MSDVQEGTHRHRQWYALFCSSMGSRDAHPQIRSHSPHALGFSCMSKYILCVCHHRAYLWRNCHLSLLRGI